MEECSISIRPPLLLLHFVLINLLFGYLLWRLGLTFCFCIIDSWFGVREQFKRIFNNSRKTFKHLFDISSKVLISRTPFEQLICHYRTTFLRFHSVIRTGPVDIVFFSFANVFSSFKSVILSNLIKLLRQPYKHSLFSAGKLNAVIGSKTLLTPVNTENYPEGN